MFESNEKVNIEGFPFNLSIQWFFICCLFLILKEILEASESNNLQEKILQNILI